MKARSKHYLHACYHAGYDAAIEQDEQCPHVPGTKENDWWWAGWSDGSMGSVRSYMKKR